MCDEEFLFLRSPSSPKGTRRRVRAMFVCPSCGWRRKPGETKAAVQ